jgi:hypothetical protein
MDKEETYNALKRFQQYVVRESRSNLKRMKKNSSNKLYQSIKGSVKVNANSFELDIQMLPYGQFQDKGVSGKKKKYNTPYSYKNKMPPARVFDKWMVRKGIAPRNEKGQFQNRKGLSFAIARGIYMNGIKPSLFFTKPFEKAFKKLSPELVEAYGLDVAELMEFTLPNLR